MGAERRIVPKRCFSQETPSQKKNEFSNFVVEKFCFRCAGSLHWWCRCELCPRCRWAIIFVLHNGLQPLSHLSLAQALGSGGQHAYIYSLIAFVQPCIKQQRVQAELFAWFDNSSDGENQCRGSCTKKLIFKAQCQTIQGQIGEEGRPHAEFPQICTDFCEFPLNALSQQCKQGSTESHRKPQEATAFRRELPQHCRRAFVFFGVRPFSCGPTAPTIIESQYI